MPAATGRSAPTASSNAARDVDRARTMPVRSDAPPLLATRRSLLPSLRGLGLDASAI